MTTALTFLRRHSIALLALTIAMGGSAYAASSITGSDVKNESLKSNDIKNNSIKATDLNDKSIPTATYSATVLAGEGSGAEIVNPYGITAVDQQGTGTYVLTIPNGGADCNFTFSPAIGPGSSPPAVTIYSTEATGDQVTVVTATANGTPTDLGPGLGYFAFSALASCPD